MAAVMKKILLLVTVILIGLNVQAQTQKSSHAPAPVTVKPTPETATPISFETSLVSGSLTLNKAFRQGESKESVVVYSLSRSNDPLFNNGKSITISLSKKSFDSVFTKTNAELAGRWADMNKYVTDNNISLTNENGWIALIKHYNNAYR
jgi:hypothetical protein